MECRYNPCKNQAEIMCDCDGCVYLCQDHIWNHTNNNISILHDTLALYSQIWREKWSPDKFIPKRKSDYKQELEACRSNYLIRNYKTKKTPIQVLVNFRYKRHQKSVKNLNLKFEENYDLMSPDTILYTAFSDTHIILFSLFKASYYNLSDFSKEWTVKLPNLFITDEGEKTMSPDCNWFAAKVCMQKHRLTRKRYLTIYRLCDGLIYDRIRFQDIHGITFSSCSNYIAAGVNENSLIIYKLIIKQIIWQFEFYSGSISRIDWNKNYMCWIDSFLNVWDVKNQYLIYQSEDKECLSTGCYWSSNCKFIIIGNNNGEILKFNTFNQKLIKHQAHTSKICDLKWGHDDEIIIMTGKEILKIFDFKNFDVIFIFTAGLQILVSTSISLESTHLAYSAGFNHLKVFKISW